VPSAAYDTVLCSEVLEHVARPDRALREIYRVLRPNGCLILSVPFLSRLHEEPHDYWRFTEHGLRTVASREGFTVRELERIGGPASFMGHQLSSVLLLPLWGVPLLRELSLLANAAVVVAPSRLLDAIPGVARKFPAGYVMVAQKCDIPDSAAEKRT
jgi:SAM-dependent methyltransferase